MKRILLLMLGISSVGLLQAQIGVNSTNPKVTLDVYAATTDGTTPEGLATPRLTLSQLISKDAKYTSEQTGAIVYVTNITGTTSTKTRNIIAIGYYYFDGTLWQTIGPDPSLRFFYMPSVVLPTNTTDASYNANTQTFTIDLYSIYSNQFRLVNSATTVKNPTATVLPVSASSALDYFITYYDNTVYQNVSVSDAGVLTYKLVPTFALSEKSFMNIVFKIK